jgi:predicted membrane metal-binding protein
VIRRLAGHLAAASAGLLVLGGLAGWARVGLPDPLPAVVGLRPGAEAVEGIVSGDPELDGPRTRVPLLLQGVTTATGTAPARGQVLVHLYGRHDPAVRLAAGDRIRARVRVSAPVPFRNPGDGDPGLRGEPRLLVIGRPDGVERLPAGALPWWLRVRLWIHRVVQRELPPASGALFEGLLVGERRQLPPGLLADFRAAGVFHILAISGFNVALVAGAVVLLLRLLRLPPRLAASVALAALVGFVAVVGAQPSVLRATVMGGLVLVAQLLRREAHLEQPRRGSWSSSPRPRSPSIEPSSLRGHLASSTRPRSSASWGPLRGRWPRPWPCRPARRSR